MIIRAELAPVFIRCYERYETDVSYLNDYMSIFVQKLETLQKFWGTWQPYHQMRIGDVLLNIWQDPNTETSMTAGMGTDGFHSSFETPEGSTVTVWFNAISKIFRVEERGYR